MEKRGVRFGTSSWKYPGWKELIYKQEYRSEKAFNEKCLTEYAENYPCVGVDHTYYAWPLESTFKKYMEETPETFRFGLKVTEKVTVFKYPNLRRYGKDAGKPNDLFLNADAFLENFLTPLEPFKSRLGPRMFEFSQFYPGMLSSGAEFTEKLEHFFRKLPTDKYCFGVEMRNQNWLKPPYLDMLHRCGVNHVYNSWTRMPPIDEQLELTQQHPQQTYLARVLLQPGTKYEEAVEAFSPYDKIQEPQPKLRAATAELVRRAVSLGVAAYVFVNNRAEGCAPKTIEGILEILSDGWFLS